MKENRILHIEEFVREKKAVSVTDICEKFHISTSTARRDFDILEGRGVVEKVYGGLRLVNSRQKETAANASALPIQLEPYQERNEHNPDAKAIIGKLAASLVEENDTIFIDSGTTCAQLAQNITDRNCTVITNSFLALDILAPYPNIRLISLSGQLNRKTFSFIGSEVLQCLSSMNINKAFMASTGISLNGGVSNAENGEYYIKKKVCEKSQKIYLLADHSKFNRLSLYTYCHLNQINGLVTDERPDEKFENYLDIHHIRLMYEK